jgi:spermidine synthase
VLLLIPLIGTTWTFVVLSLLLTTVAIVGLGISSQWRKAIIWLWMPVVLIVLGILVSRSGIKTTFGQIYETESEYNYIQVIEKDGYRYLRLNEGQGVHSVYHPTDLRYYGPWMQFLSAPFFNEPPYEQSRLNHVAVVGLAAGTVARQISAVFGPVWIDGYEIDPKIIEVGRKYFGMDMPNLHAQAVDGRWGLEKSQQTYDLVVVDAYRPPYIPWHLTTQEFFKIVSDHLTQDGVAAINVGRAETDRRMIDALVGTLQTVFPSIYVLDVPGTFNSVIFATKQPTKAENLFQNYFDLINRGNLHPLLKESMEISALNLKPLPETTTVFTDDNAPVEWITNSMVLDYIFTGDMEVLR